MGRKRRIARVDYQVSIVTAIIVLASFLCVYFFNYNVTYDDMMHSLKERSNSIYKYVENYVDKSTFHENKELTSSDVGYKKMKQKLEDVKQATNVIYLYTAKQTSDGEYIYLVDGLASNSPDFRNPGDVIEPEIIPEMQMALNDNIILPDKIKETTWGHIFISYYPIHDGNKVVGVLGIEFDATHQYNAFKIIRIGTPIIAVVACIVSVIIALLLFRRISNPLYKDMANTDYLTNLKNRNAFEIDFRNFNRQKRNIGFLVADLNDLKIVNDTLGHQVGDEYIHLIGQLLSNCARQQPVYRFGGDEFVVVCQNCTFEKIQALSFVIYEALRKENENTNTCISLSIGYAVYDKGQDSSLNDTFKRADQHMYEVKKEMKTKC